LSASVLALTVIRRIRRRVAARDERKDLRCTDWWHVHDALRVVWFRAVNTASDQTTSNLICYRSLAFRPNFEPPAPARLMIDLFTQYFSFFPFAPWEVEWMACSHCLSLWNSKSCLLTIPI
jgi:hypothetical protein